MILIHTESGCGFLKCKVSTTLTLLCGARGPATCPSPTQSILLSLSHSSSRFQWFSCFSLHEVHREDRCKLQNPALQRFCSLVLGQVPGICLFKKHCRNFCCRHPRTTPETLWPALVFSLGPLEGCMSLWLQIMDFISPFGWFTCVMSLVMPLLTQPDS